MDAAGERLVATYPEDGNVVSVQGRPNPSRNGAHTLAPAMAEEP
jgi:hypothetical protein